ncbi:MAG: PIN domain-containing protein [Verrucomicrobiota bacterium]
MSVGLDTSVVLRLLVGEPEAQAAKAHALLDQLTEKNESALVSDLVVAEVYFALHYHYQVPKREALSALRHFLNAPEIENDGVALNVLATPKLESAKPGFVDRMIHQQYRNAAGGMVTFEKAAKKLTDTMVL